MSQLILPVGKRDHLQGSEQAPVALLEYGDYECPFCGQAHSIVKRISEEMNNDLRFAFRNFPLTQIHPHALPAALAAEAAGLQGRFWEMHHLLFENQDALEEEDLLSYAQSLGLEEDQFVRDMQSDSVMLRVREDFMSGIRSGANSTPTFFINNIRHDGSYDYETLILALRHVARYNQMRRNA